MTEENTPFRHMSSSLWGSTRATLRSASIHDRIFFSRICRYLFWDEGYEDSSAKCVALCGKWIE